MPKSQIIEHDFRQGPWWPGRTFDFAWSVEVLEHIGRQHMKNYLPIFHKAAIIWVTHAMQGGYHHVETHEDWWWINRYTLQGFIYSEDLTKRMRRMAGQWKNVDGFNSQHLWHSGLAFLNPKVGSLYEHAHLFGGPGCFTSKDRSFPCGTTPGPNMDGRAAQGRTDEDTLPGRFLPRFNTPTKWDNDIAVQMRPKGVHGCKSDYDFPTSHDGCADVEGKSLKPRP